MVYTCAYFQPDWHDDLARAQVDKLDMICRKLRLKPGERLLDIGCGWGALICHAAQHYGVKATGVTLAEEQAALAREKIAALGLQDRVEVLLKDFTQMEGEFDKISSIGMFEHVGIANHPAYFTAVHRLLRPRGLYLHHTIARRAKRTEQAFRKLKPEYKALTRYIFPGGELDHLGMSVSNLERYGFEVHDVEAWREHYQRTTRLWWENLNARRKEAEALGRAGEDAHVAALSRRLLARLRARRGGHQPDARLQAHARSLWRAVEPGGFVFIRKGTVVLLSSRSPAQGR